MRTHIKNALKSAFAASALAGSFVAGLDGAASAELEKPLDREKIVARHRIRSENLDLKIPIGNGNFCFNVDGTGLQTFGGDVLAHWGWFSEPLPPNYTWADVPQTGTYQRGRLQGADPFPQDRGDLYQWVRNNPRQANLARVRFVRGDGAELRPDEISNVRRDLDLWTGLHATTFELDGETVSVETCVGDDKALDSTVAVRIDSPLLRSGALAVVVDFPYPSLKFGAWTGDFSADAPKTDFAVSVPNGFNENNGENASPSGALIVKRNLSNEYAEGVVGDYSYSVRVDWANGVGARLGETSSIRVSGTGVKTDKTGVDPQPLDLLLTFDGGDYSCRPTDDSVFSAQTPQFDAVKAESAKRWETFWRSGAAIDLSGSADPRWRELERRVVLSQFQLRTNSAGNWPSSESGLLTVDAWNGRFHLEMTWWHLAHYFLWNRAELADDALKIYPTVKDGARALAEQLGYQGVKWQKEIAPDGRTAPWLGNLVLLWKQPHPIFFAELDYRRAPTRETLLKWADMIEETADHMADYPVRDDAGVYHLAPNMPPSEQGTTKDCVFDLAYWRWGLDAANRWRERLGLERVERWDEVRRALAPLPQKDGVFVHSAEWLDSFEKRNWEHPDLIGVFGMLPPLDGVDRATARRTLERVVAEWQWQRCWGWDFPWTAMAATRVGRPDLAIEALLNDSPRNDYDERGVNLGGPCPYLPGNGGLLYAVAAMCAGFDTEADAAVDPADRPAPPTSGDSGPGFPDGWSVKWEKLKPAL